MKLRQTDSHEANVGQNKEVFIAIQCIYKMTRRKEGGEVHKYF